MPTPRKHPDRPMTNAERQAAARERARKARAQELQQKGLPPSPAVPTMPSSARWNGLTATALAALITQRDEREAYYSDRSEAWQESDRGTEFQARTEELQQIIDALENLT